MKANWQYLKYLMKHKYYVFLEGRKLGLNYYRLLVHDLSKFSSKEWKAYRNYFYTDSKSQAEFDLAWLHHQKVNSHHWQYWILFRDTGEQVALKMPYFDMLEMIADWRGVGRALYGNKANALHWYNDNKEHIILHPATRTLVEYHLNDGQ